MNKLQERIKSNLFQNILSLGAIQILNYIIPLITIPYVVRVLGPEKFGLVNFAGAFVGYFLLLTDYGFNLSATREIAINRENSSKVNEIISAILAIKFILFVISIIVLSIAIYTFQIFRNDPRIYWISFISVLGNLITPLWFFRGVEKMKLITIPTLIVRALSVILIFHLVKIKDDYYYYAAINCFGGFVIGISTIVLMKKYYSVKFIIPQLESLIYHVKDGGLMFLSSISISLYTLSNTFILGLFASPEIVGYYAAADKIRIAAQNLLSPITQAIYPHLSRLFNESKKMGFAFIKKILLSFGVFSLIGCSILFFYPRPITLLVLGDTYQRSIVVLRIISFLPFIIFMSNLLGVQAMVNLGYKKAFTVILILAGIVNLLFAFILVPKYFEIGTSISVLITEVFVTVAMLLFLKKNIPIHVKI